MGSNEVYLTANGLKKLEDELEHLHTVRRQEVAQRLREAMQGGELIDNAEYEAAKNEQAFIEGRILEVEYIVSQAKLIEPGKTTDVVGIGSTVVVKQNGKKRETFTIVGAAEADPKAGLISNESPLGQALLDHTVGDEVEVIAPAGVLSFRIIKIK